MEKQLFQAHPWHGVSPGARSPESLNAYIEIVPTDPVKYELDKSSGLIRLDRVLYSAVYYPANYGFIPQTLAEDDDPLDVLVLCQETVVPLTIIHARCIGLMTMIDAGKKDHKIIAIATEDPEFNSYREASEMPPHRLIAGAKSLNWLNGAPARLASKATKIRWISACFPKRRLLTEVSFCARDRLAG